VIVDSRVEKRCAWSRFLRWHVDAAYAARATFPGMMDVGESTGARLSILLLDLAIALWCLQAYWRAWVLLRDYGLLVRLGQGVGGWCAPAPVTALQSVERKGREPLGSGCAYAI